MDTLRIGDKVKWVSAKGELNGGVKEIYLALNANSKLIPWLIIEDHSGYRINMCATDEYLTMMKVEKIS